MFCDKSQDKCFKSLKALCNALRPLSIENEKKEEKLRKSVDDNWIKIDFESIWPFDSILPKITCNKHAIR